MWPWLCGNKTILVSSLFKILWGLMKSLPWPFLLLEAFGRSIALHLHTRVQHVYVWLGLLCSAEKRPKDRRGKGCHESFYIKQRAWFSFEFPCCVHASKKDQETARSRKSPQPKAGCGVKFLLIMHRTRPLIVDFFLSNWNWIYTIFKGFLFLMFGSVLGPYFSDLVTQRDWERHIEYDIWWLMLLLLASEDVCLPRRAFSL